MVAHKSDFSTFGSAVSTLTFESSDGNKYRVDDNGLIISVDDTPDVPIAPGSGKVYVISVAISDSLGREQSLLRGIDNDTSRFLAMVDAAYADNPGLIAGVARLNDDDTKYSTGKGTLENVDKAFDDAKSKNVDFVIFHYSDHGERRTLSNDGFLYTYGGHYTYARLFSKL